MPMIARAAWGGAGAGMAEAVLVARCSSAKEHISHTSADNER